MRWDSKTSRGNTSGSQKLNKVWALFFLKEKKSLKGSAILLSWQHCISISSTMGWATGQTENKRCINRGKNEFVLTLTALIYMYVCMYVCMCIHSPASLLGTPVQLLGVTNC